MNVERGAAVNCRREYSHNSLYHSQFFFVVLSYYFALYYNPSDKISKFRILAYVIYYYFFYNSVFGPEHLIYFKQKGILSNRIVRRQYF